MLQSAVMSWKPLLLVAVAFTAALPEGHAQQANPAEQAELAKKYPSIRIKVNVGTRRRQVNGSTYMKTMVMTPSVAIESASTQPMAVASATCLLITMDTREKYTRGDEELTVATNESIDIPAVPKGQRRSFDFAELQTQFDSDRDSTNIGGDVYKYFIMAVFSDDNKFLHFETNCQALDKHLKANPDLRIKFLGLKPGEKFRTRFQ